jgi:hypothetical protein
VVSCQPEHELRIQQWIRHGMEEGDDSSSIHLPYATVPELTYLAWLADTWAATPGMTFTNEGLRNVRWLVRCRNLAIHTGAEAPLFIRSEPLLVPGS